MEEKGRRKALKPPGAAGARKPPAGPRKPPPIQAGQLGPPDAQLPMGSPTSPMSPTTRAAVKQASCRSLSVWAWHCCEGTSLGQLAL